MRPQPRSLCEGRKWDLRATQRIHVDGDRRYDDTKPVHRKGWVVQVASGALTVNGEQLAAGDGAAIAYENNVTIRASADTELLLFDIA